MLETETFTIEKGRIVESTCLTRLGRKVDSLEFSFFPLKQMNNVIEIKDRRSRSRNMSKISRTCEAVHIRIDLDLWKAWGREVNADGILESEETLKLMSKNSSEVLLVHYFFHDLGEPQEKTFGGLLHAIVHQLLVGFHTKNRATLSRLYELLKPYLSSDLTLKEALPNHILENILDKLVAVSRTPEGMFVH